MCKYLHVYICHTLLYSVTVFTSVVIVCTGEISASSIGGKQSYVHTWYSSTVILCLSFMCIMQVIVGESYTIVRLYCTCMCASLFACSHGLMSTFFFLIKRMIQFSARNSTLGICRWIQAQDTTN